MSSELFEIRAGCEDEIVGFEDLLDDFVAGGDEALNVAHLEKHERAVLGREMLKGAPYKGAKLVEVSDESVVPAHSSTKVKLEVLPLTDGIITLDTLQVAVQYKGLTYIPEQPLKIYATSTGPA